MIVGLALLFFAIIALLISIVRIVQSPQGFEKVHKELQHHDPSNKVQENTWNKCFIQEAEAIVNNYQRRKAIFRPAIESKDNEDS